MIISPLRTIDATIGEVDWDIKPEIRIHYDNQTLQPSGRLAIYGLAKLPPTSSKPRGDEHAMTVDLGSQEGLRNELIRLLCLVSREAKLDGYIK